MIKGKKITYWLLHIIRWMVFLVWTFLTLIFLIASPEIGIILAISALFMCPLIHNKLNRIKIRAWLQVLISFVFMFISLSMIPTLPDEDNAVKVTKNETHSSVNTSSVALEPTAVPTAIPSIIPSSVPTVPPNDMPTVAPTSTPSPEIEITSSSGVTKKSSNGFLSGLFQDVKNFFTKKEDQSSLTPTVIPTTTPSVSEDSIHSWNGTYSCPEYDIAELTITQIDASNLTFTLKREDDDVYDTIEKQTAKIKADGSTAVFTAVFGDSLYSGELRFYLYDNCVILDGNYDFSNWADSRFPCSGTYVKDTDSKIQWDGTYTCGTGELGEEFGNLEIKQIDSKQLKFTLNIELLQSTGLIEDEIAYISEDGHSAVFSGLDGYKLYFTWDESVIKLTDEQPNSNPYSYSNQIDFNGVYWKDGVFPSLGAS